MFWGHKFFLYSLSSCAILECYEKYSTIHFTFSFLGESDSLPHLLCKDLTFMHLVWHLLSCAVSIFVSVHLGLDLKFWGLIFNPNSFENSEKHLIISYTFCWLCTKKTASLINTCLCTSTFRVFLDDLTGTELVCHRSTLYLHSFDGISECIKYTMERKIVNRYKSDEVLRAS